MREALRIAAIGELLWDLLPEGPQLGGAPANFAAILAQMVTSDSTPGDGDVFLVTCVGNDLLGQQAHKQMIAHGVRADCIAVNRSLPTGTVEVQLDAERGPQYRICKPVAWDEVPETSHLTALAPTLDAICFGTLAQRSPMTRATLRAAVAATSPDCLRVFDVNLREPDWTAEAIVWGAAHATLFKMNDEEVPHVAQAIGAEIQDTPLQVAHCLLRQFPIHLVAITRGTHGSLLVTRNESTDHPGIPTQLVDSIGAGDCFTAGLTYFSLHDQPLSILAESANRWGAWAASQRGGMPYLDAASRNYLEMTDERRSISQSYPNG